MLKKIYYGFVTSLLIASSLVWGDNLSIGTRYNNNIDYHSNNYSFSNNFNTEYSGTLSFSNDAVSNNYSSWQLAMQKQVTAAAFISLSFGNDFSRDISNTNTIGLQYSQTFTKNTVSSSNSTNVANKQLPQDDAWAIIPRLNIGANISRTKYVSPALTDTAFNPALGGGIALGSYFDLSLDWNGFFYGSEKSLKNIKPFLTRRKSILFQKLKSSPKYSLDSTLTYILNSVLRLYYGSAQAADLQDNLSGSTTAGLTYNFLENWSLDYNAENSGGTLYSTITCSYNF